MKILEVFLPLLFTASGFAEPITIRESLITLPIAKKFNSTGVRNILKGDQARAKALLEWSKGKPLQGLHERDPGSIQIENVAVSYVATIGVGQPPTNYSLLVDTGSANTWVGAGKQYVRTSTSVQTPDRVSVTYGTGSFSGIEFTDTVTAGQGLVINQQSIGVASRSDGFNGYDGVLGLGPAVLTQGTLSPDVSKIIPTVTDTLFAQAVIPFNEIGISFNPTNVIDAINGEITFGGIDTSRFTGPITFSPITQVSPSNLFWGIDQSITYGQSQSTILPLTGGIVDTGSTLILLSDDAFQRYKSNTGAVLDQNTGFLRLTSAQFGALQSLFFHIGGTTFEFIPNAQIWPRSLNFAIGGNSNSVYLIVNTIGGNEQGMAFINGYTFLERYYSVYDTQNKRVGIARTPNTFSMIN